MSGAEADAVVAFGPEGSCMGGGVELPIHSGARTMNWNRALAASRGAALASGRRARAMIGRTLTRSGSAVGMCAERDPAAVASLV